MAAPLVDYPSSDDSDAAPNPAPQNKSNEAARPPPALPAAFHALYPTAARPSTADDPALHDGRKRQLPHTPGVWPTHVYIECLLSSPFWTVENEDLTFCAHRAT